MNSILHKQLPNYLLPTEGKEILKAIPGRTIQKIYSGTWCKTKDDLLDRNRDIMEEGQNIMTVAHGGPLFIMFDNNKTFVFQSDEFAQSIVFREMDTSLDNKSIIEIHNQIDYYWDPFLQIKCMIDLGDCGDFVGRKVRALKILKLPDNHLGAPIYGHYVHEVAVVLKLEDSSELLIAYRMGNKLKNVGHCLMRWEDVAEDYPINALTCVFQYP